jgi:3-oxocholest-4-en-26-oate---CoA ligase
MEMHFATIWESLADAIGDADAVVQGARRISWHDFDDQAARFAGFLRANGIGGENSTPVTGQAKLGLYLYNSPEYLIAQYGAFKERLVPLNVNYRYLDNELLYLLENGDVEVLVYHASLADRVARVKDKAPMVKLWVEVDDEGGQAPLPGSVSWTAATTGAPASRITRSEDDLYMLYTGGTTGMPKGVMYQMGGFCGGLLLGYPILAQVPPPVDAASIAPFVAAFRQKIGGRLPVSVPACPLMHGTGVWIGAFIPQHLGSAVLLLEGRNFDADEFWRTVERENVTLATIVGDAFAKPMVRSLEAARDRGEPFDVSPLKIILSAGVMWSSEVKAQLLEFGDFALADLLGSSEASMGSTMTTRQTGAETAKFTANETTKVFVEADGEWRPVVPGSGEIGMVAAGGNTPMGYYKDEAKSDRTFRMINGARYSFPGDMALINADGSLTLLGRGSNCINTAGEKVFPEEVEESVKRHDAVLDCLVVGLPDEKFGERVVAVASLQGAAAGVDAAALIAHVKAELAGYKAPKQVLIVDTVRRAPNGKADYGWAKEVAVAAFTQ